METKKPLPILEDLYNDADIEVFRKQDDFLYLLNHQPKSEWVKVNKLADNSLYIPIAIIETLLQKIFRFYKIEVLKTAPIFNSVEVTVRVHYKDPVTGDWLYHDGIGSVYIGKSGDTTTALPMAKSLAIKDATDHLGRLFGRDLNRREVLPYKSEEVTKSDNLQELKKLFEEVKEQMKPEDTIYVERIIKHEETNSYKKAIIKLKQINK